MYHLLPFCSNFGSNMTLLFYTCILSGLFSWRLNASVADRMQASGRGTRNQIRSVLLKIPIHVVSGGCLGFLNNFAVLRTEPGLIPENDVFI